MTKSNCYIFLYQSPNIKLVINRKLIFKYDVNYFIFVRSFNLWALFAQPSSQVQISNPHERERSYQSEYHRKWIAFLIMVDFRIQISCLRLASCKTQPTGCQCITDQWKVNCNCKIFNVFSFHVSGTTQVVLRSAIVTVNVDSRETRNRRLANPDQQH